MHSDPFMRAMSRISDAALTSDQWPTALQSIAEAVGTLGAVYYLLNKLTGGVESISVAGFSVDADEFVNYYAARDLFKPLLEATPTGSWLRLAALCCSRGKTHLVLGIRERIGKIWRMKNYLYLLLAIGLVTGFVGCSQSEENQSSPPATNAPAPAK